jgi:hypothetical protein
VTRQQFDLQVRLACDMTAIPPDYMLALQVPDSLSFTKPLACRSPHPRSREHTDPSGIYCSLVPIPFCALHRVRYSPEGCYSAASPQWTAQQLTCDTVSTVPFRQMALHFMGYISTRCPSSSSSHPPSTPSNPATCTIPSPCDLSQLCTPRAAVV